MKRARYVLAIDGREVFLRRTLCVTHNSTLGEAIYDTKPVRPSAAPKAIQKIYKNVRALLEGGATE